MPKTVKDAGYSQEHVLERALERYHLTLTPADYAALNTILTEAKASPSASAAAKYCADDATTEIWEVPFKGKLFVTVWGKESGRVETLLPEGTVLVQRKQWGKAQQSVAQAEADKGNGKKGEQMKGNGNGKGKSWGCGRRPERK